MAEKIKGAMLHLGRHFVKSGLNSTELGISDENWEFITKEIAAKGMNTIFLDIHEALHWGSHPELAIPAAWTRQRMRREIKRLKEMGITIVPKVNFSACHDFWLKMYKPMISTPEYYKVCRDIIFELANLFEDSPYIHLGMDEEDHRHAKNFDLSVYRQGNLLWHDMQFLLDCVRDCGKTPIIWGSTVVYQYEDFKANISPEDLIVMIYHYHGVKEEHWIRTDSREDYNKYYNVNGPYVGMGMEILERDDPFYIHFRKNALKSAKDGYNTILCISNFYKHEHNAEDVVEMGVKDWPQERLKGIITAPWKSAYKGDMWKEHYNEGITLLDNAFRKFGY